MNSFILKLVLKFLLSSDIYLFNNLLCPILLILKENSMMGVHAYNFF